MDYKEIWNGMKENVWYTATELGLKGASAAAMVKRGLVKVDLDAKPRKYCKAAVEHHGYAAVKKVVGEGLFYALRADGRRTPDIVYFAGDLLKDHTAKIYNDAFDRFVYKGVLYGLDGVKIASNVNIYGEEQK